MVRSVVVDVVVRSVLVVIGCWSGLCGEGSGISGSRSIAEGVFAGIEVSTSAIFESLFVGMSSNLKNVESRSERGYKISLSLTTSMAY